MKIRLFTFTLACIILTACTAAAESSKKSPTPAATEPPLKVTHTLSRPLPFNGRISAIDKAAGTFSTENKQKQVRIFTVTAETKFTRKNAPATFDDLKIGDEVRGSAVPKGEGHFETLSVIAGPPEEPKIMAATSPAPKALPAPKASPAKTKKNPASAKSPTPSVRVEKAEKVAD